MLFLGVNGQNPLGQKICFFSIYCMKNKEGSHLTPSASVACISDIKKNLFCLSVKQGCRAGTLQPSQSLGKWPATRDTRRGMKTSSAVTGRFRSELYTSTTLPSEYQPKMEGDFRCCQSKIQCSIGALMSSFGFLTVHLLALKLIITGQVWPSFYLGAINRPYCVIRMLGLSLG